MNPERANWMTEEIFARRLAHFCRVMGAAAVNCAGATEKSAGFIVFYGCDEFISPWHDRC